MNLWNDVTQLDVSHDIFNVGGDFYLSLDHYDLLVVPLVEESALIIGQHLDKLLARPILSLAVLLKLKRRDRGRMFAALIDLSKESTDWLPKHNHHTVAIMGKFKVDHLGNIFKSNV
jgi:hypothetical protein